MLLWLNGTSNNVWNPNENYARELQELFCLGAGNGYTERDVRQLARALTGFANDWTDPGRSASATRRSCTTPSPRRSTASAASSPGRRASGSSPATAATPSSWSRSCGATSSPPSPSAATRKALARLYVESGP